MWTAKERAEVLVYKFKYCIDSDMSFQKAKECAIIAADEILSEHFGDDSEYGSRRYDYYLEVKQEINIL